MSPGGDGPPPPEGLPRQRRGTVPQGRGRYPDYDVLADALHWDPVTRETVLDRVAKVPPLRFFDAREARALRAFCDTAMAQDSEPRIPVLEMVDKKLHEGRLDGFQYADMPDDREVWRRVAVRLDETARARGHADFAACDEDAREEIVGAFARGELEWEDMPSEKAWSVVMRAVLSEFYSHPWAWNEIGFGGPRYPRGYMRLSAGPTGRDPDEAREDFDLDPVRDVAERGDAP